MEVKGRRCEFVNLPVARPQFEALHKVGCYTVRVTLSDSPGLTLHSAWFPESYCVFLPTCEMRRQRRRRGTPSVETPGEQSPSLVRGMRRRLLLRLLLLFPPIIWIAVRAARAGRTRPKGTRKGKGARAYKGTPDWSAEHGNRNWHLNFGTRFFMAG